MNKLALIFTFFSLSFNSIAIDKPAFYFNNKNGYAIVLDFKGMVEDAESLHTSRPSDRPEHLNRLLVTHFTHFLDFAKKVIEVAKDSNLIEVRLANFRPESSFGKYLITEGILKIEDHQVFLNREIDERKFNNRVFLDMIDLLEPVTPESKHYVEFVTTRGGPAENMASSVKSFLVDGQLDTINVVVTHLDKYGGEEVFEINHDRVLEFHTGIRDGLLEKLNEVTQLESCGKKMTGKAQRRVL